MNKAQKGFSLLELVTVVAIILIVTAMAVPAVRQTISSYQLDASGHAVASMLQQVRSAAVKNNTPYYAQYNGVAGPGLVLAVPAERFTAMDYKANVDPTVNVASNVVFMPAAGPPTHAQLETAMGLAPGAPNLQIGGVIAFNGRGLPCVLNATPWRCTNIGPNGPVAFEWFLQNNMSQQWAAITVSPAGRIRTWRMSTDGVWQ